MLFSADVINSHQSYVKQQTFGLGWLVFVTLIFGEIETGKKKVN
jgi:hypothetical protein